MHDYVLVEVMWDLVVDGEKLPMEEAPAIVQKVPREVYDDGYKNDGAVESYLSMKTGFLVVDWRLA